jgi:hypothetical protein
MKTTKYQGKVIAILAPLLATSLASLAVDKTVTGSEESTPTAPKAKMSATANGKDTDHFADLVARLNKTMGLWKNGIYIPINLPAEAKAQEVLNKALEFKHKDSSLRKKHKVVEVRKVTVNGVHFAVLLDYPDGSRIFLCRYEGAAWWHNFYKVPDFQPAEQDGADQPATAPESKPEGKQKPKQESEGRSQ